MLKKGFVQNCYSYNGKTCKDVYIFCFYNFYEINNSNRIGIIVTGLTRVTGMTGHSHIIQHTVLICLHNTVQFFNFTSQNFRLG